ncbi:MAG: DUF2459 domain-containing protein [Heteroscytonema crispum UTEX LB 1556]
MKNTNTSAFLNLLYRFGCHFLSVSLATLTLLAIGAFIPIKWVYSSRHSCDLKICVSNTGIHSNIIIPTNNHIYDWHNYLSIDTVGIDAAKDYKYLSFGWGDRAFYMSTPNLANLRFSTTFKALFLPTPSVMYVKGYQLIPDYSEVKCIAINQKDYLQLIKFIQGTFQVNANKEKIRLGNGHTDNAGFYAAKGSYSILNNCNSWTAEALRKANINTPLWDGLSSAILFHLKSNCEEN